jgi:hypothetical protein
MYVTVKKSFSRKGVFTVCCGYLSKLTAGCNLQTVRICGEENEKVVFELTETFIMVRVGRVRAPVLSAYVQAFFVATEQK